MSILFLLLGFTAGTVYGAFHQSGPDQQQTHAMNMPETDEGWWTNYDKIVHILSDMQPNPDPNDSCGAYDSYERVGDHLELLDEHVPFTPDYLVMTGDVHGGKPRTGWVRPVFPDVQRFRTEAFTDPLIREFRVLWVKHDVRQPRLHGAVRQLESELNDMKQAGEKNNVFLFFHHRFPNTVKNCHDRPAL